MTFAHPYFLLLLLLLPVLAWLKGKRGRQPAFLYSSVQLVKGIIGITRSNAGGMLLKLRWLALACFIVALAQPRMILSESKVHASGVDIVVALDLSGSMAAEDDGFILNGQQATRFMIAKDTLKKFIAKRPNDRLGLVIFATHAFVVVPPTLDHDFLSANLERLELNMEGFDDHSTAIGSALSTSLNRLRDLQSKSKIVILMTDGENNAGKIPPLTAAEAAQALGVKVYTIGVGTRGEARIQQMDIFGNRHYVKIPVDVDEDTLTKIANMNGGKYYRADSSATLNKIYNDIDRLEKTDVEVKKYTQYNELFSWVILPGLFFVL
ncbi:MAG TPA: VWA domain-containing protein, partial [Verrucomicrobiae bacterium]|nr:VWA domain-containing protein [Verrucomicrobiae bacterium]